MGFFSRKIFLNTLGDELLGLNTTLGNILSFLNLAELGIGIAMATSLYKPIHNQDQETICEIISVQGILYKRIALLLCLLSIPIIISLPFFFPHTECGTVYVIFAYIVFLWGSISSYLWNYRQILIGADQKNYKLRPWIHTIRYTKIFMQIFFLTVINLGVWGWIALELVGSTCTIFVINFIIQKEYPWLRASNQPTKKLFKKYHFLIVKTKQLFVHKIGSFVLEQTAPLIIYYYVSLSMVTYYGNYMMLIGYTVTLLNVIFEGMGASIGSLVSENNKRHTLNVFWELFSSRIWISGIACFTLYISIAPFITLWIGEKYVLSNTTLILLIVGMFIRMTRSVVDSFKNAYQLFADVWSPIAEACINLGCSILFGYWWGLNGIIMGSNLSLILIVLLWKPYYTFKHGLKASWINYYLQYFLHILILIGTAVISISCMKTTYYQTDDYLHLMLNIAATIIIFTVITFIILYVLTSGMRQFTYRLINLKKNI
ncbi:MAG: sugar transporter [Paludibacteraceae bacterium]|nr:sugar transporter [Paludibacteraceae bacterium]